MEEKLLDGFPVIVEFPVAWGDMDALKHVNNVTYFRYFENARIAYFERIKMWEFYGRPKSVRSGLDSVQVSRAPDLSGHGLDRTRISDIGPDGFTMKYSVASQRLSKIAAEAEGCWLPMITGIIAGSRCPPS